MWVYNIDYLCARCLITPCFCPHLVGTYLFLGNPIMFSHKKLIVNVGTGTFCPHLGNELMCTSSLMRLFQSEQSNRKNKWYIDMKWCFMWLYVTILQKLCSSPCKSLKCLIYPLPEFLLPTVPQWNRFFRSKMWAMDITRLSDSWS